MGRAMGIFYVISPNNLKRDMGGSITILLGCCWKAARVLLIPAKFSFLLMVLRGRNIF
jgi:hypothetical protein